MKPLHRTGKRLAVFGAVMICSGIAVGIWQLTRPPEKTMFHLDPAQVTAVTLRNANKLTSVTFTDPEEREEIVDLLNGFTYWSSKDYPPATGWSYCLNMETENGEDLSVEFSLSGVKTSHSDGSSTYYEGPEGYFQKLVDLAESATDPL